jgi:hypothetical protein
MIPIPNGGAFNAELAWRQLPVTEPVPEPAAVSLPVDLAEPSWIAAQKHPGIPVPPFVAFGPSGERRPGSPDQ